VTVEEVQAKRDQVWEVVRRHGVDRLTVAVAEPDYPLPYDYDAYFEVGFTPEAKAVWRGEQAIGYVNAISDMAEELSELLGCRAWVGDLDGVAKIRPSGEALKARATPL
jgi:hypothetical protein